MTKTLRSLILFAGILCFPFLLPGQKREQVDSLFRVSDAVLIASIDHDDGCTDIHDLGTCYSYCWVDSLHWLKGRFPAVWKSNYIQNCFDIEYITWGYDEWKYKKEDLSFRKGKTYIFFLNENAVRESFSPFTLTLERKSAYRYRGRMRKWLVE